MAKLACSTAPTAQKSHVCGSVAPHAKQRPQAFSTSSPVDSISLDGRTHAPGKIRGTPRLIINEESTAAFSSCTIKKGLEKIFFSKKDFSRIFFAKKDFSRIFFAKKDFFDQQ
jgi:hypothetical protein